MRYKGNFSLMMGSLLVAGRQAVVPPQLRPVRRRPSGDRQPAVLRFQGTDVLLELRRRLANARGVGQRNLSRSRSRCATCRLLSHRREHGHPRRVLGPVHAGRGSGRPSDAHLAVRRSVGQPVQARRAGRGLDDVRSGGLREEDQQGHGRLQRHPGCDRGASRGPPCCCVARQSRAALRRRPLPALARGESGRRQLGRLRPLRAQLLPLRGSRKERPPRLDTLGQQLLLRPDPVRGESCRHGPAVVRRLRSKVRWSAASRWSDRTTTCCSRTLGRAGR